MTPTQAASALQDLERFEEGLSARVGGLTCFLWGIVSAGIFATYGLATAAGWGGWWMMLLWAPWVALGALASNLLWRLHAISLAKDAGAPSRASPWFGLAILGFFLTSLLLLHLLSGVFHGLSHTAGILHFMLAVNGLACFFLVLLASRRYGRLAATPLLPAGVLMLAASFAMAHLALGDAGAAAFSAATVAIGYCGAGLAVFVRG